ncbi:MAG TPA: hypothetical protein PK597_02970 [Oscillospiraceae bacterium]|nr:hypothetical protein [Oscillospiraceae bacterium]
MRLFQVRFASLCAVGLLFAMLSACSGGGSGASSPTPAAASEDPAPASAVISVDSNDETAVVHYEGEEGEVDFEVGTAGEVSIPSDYPEDLVPLYPGGKVTLAGVEGGSFMIVASTNDDFDAIYSFFDENIEFDEAELRQNVKGYVLLSGSVGEYYVNVTATENTPGGEEANLITIVVTPES